MCCTGQYQGFAHQAFEITFTGDLTSSFSWASQAVVVVFCPRQLPRGTTATAACPARCPAAKSSKDYADTEHQQLPLETINSQMPPKNLMRRTFLRLQAYTLEVCKLGLEVPNTS